MEGEQRAGAVPNHESVRRWVDEAKDKGWWAENVMGHAWMPVGHLREYVSEFEQLRDRVAYLEAVVQAGIEQVGIDTFKRAGFFRDG